MTNTIARQALSPCARDRYLATPYGLRLAYRRVPGKSPTVVFLGGFASAMSGLKARCFERLCVTRGYGFLRFDYRGHGASEGLFEDGTLGAWIRDARCIIGALTRGPLLLVGSSMGAWIMLHVALSERARVCGLMGIASAPDFTRELIEAGMNTRQRAELRGRGRFTRPGDADESPKVITARLLDEARAHLVLDRRLDIQCPVSLVHGLADRDVPWGVSVRLAEALAGDDVQLRLLKGGGHRLSEPAELHCLELELDALLARIVGAKSTS